MSSGSSRESRWGYFNKESEQEDSFAAAAIQIAQEFVVSRRILEKKTSVRLLSRCEIGEAQKATS